MPKILNEEDDMSLVKSTIRVAYTKTRTSSKSVSAAGEIAKGSSRKTAGLVKTTTTIITKKTTSETKSRATIQAVLDSLEKETMHRSWYNALEEEFKKPYFAKLKQFLVEENVSHTVFPPMEQIYSWSRLTPLDNVKVVILGQDPYHNIGQAHGLSFSVLPPTKPPGSLKNIYKQLNQDIPGFTIPSTGDLSPVAKLGVLWLNTSLTVRAHKAASHAKKGWEIFTAEVLRKVIARVNAEHPGVVFMAWGLPAQKTYSMIGIDETKHLVLKSAHPSPLSAHKGFLGNGHFKKANEWLEANYGPGSGIDWNVLNKPSTGQ